MSGPLPDPDAERRNAPTIPTTRLPAGGRRGPTPDPPAWISLGRAGMSWWAWAWHTPQACAWDDGQIVKVAYRAKLEDSMAAIEHGDELDHWLRRLSQKDRRDVKALVAHLAGLVTNELGIVQKMTDLDDRLGLSPKGRDQLRWKVVADDDYYPVVDAEDSAPQPGSGGTVTRIDERRQRSVDAS